MMVNSPGSTTNCLSMFQNARRSGVMSSDDGFRFAGLQCDSLEALQLLHRARRGAHQVADVKLHDFVAGPLAGVRHVDQHARFSVAADR